MVPMSFCKTETEAARPAVDALELRLIAATDGLTGTLTRRAFQERGQSDVERARRHGGPLSCATIDIDDFKRVNDSHGHAAGDLVLQHVVTVCKAELRGVDYIGRVGGDEFAVMLPEISLVNAYSVADRLRRNIEAATIEIAGQPVLTSVSIGVAEFLGLGGNLEGLLREADTALYDAKLDGKNQVACYFGDIRFAPDRQPDTRSGAGGIEMAAVGKYAQPAGSFAKPSDKKGVDS
jgi:diguanylate cyclase (GGDEF)-like protein